MKFYSSFILLNILQLVVCETHQCTYLEIEPNEIFIAKKESILIIESDEHEIENLNYENYKIIQESQRIKTYEKEDAISAQIIQLNGTLKIFSKLFCQLLKSEYYFISCIKVQDQNQYDREDFKEQNKLQIVSSIKDEHICQEFYYEFTSGFILFCFQDFYLKVYILDFENKTTLLGQHKIEDNMYKLCKRKIIQRSDDNYMIAFEQCQNWGLFAFYQNQINILLNDNILFNNYSQQIGFLLNVQICYNMIRKKYYKILKLCFLHTLVIEKLKLEIIISFIQYLKQQ